MGKPSVARKLAINEANAVLRRLRTSPIKLNQVAGLIRGLRVEEALIQLDFCKRRIAHSVKKVLLSAVANAENNHNLDVDRLKVKEIKVGKAMVMRRYNARARGRGARILKPFSHIEIIVQETETE